VVQRVEERGERRQTRTRGKSCSFFLKGVFEEKTNKRDELEEDGRSEYQSDNAYMKNILLN